VVLEDAPLWMRYRVVGGRPVFSRDDVARVRHRAATEMEFLDFKPYYDEQLAAVHERARVGRLSRG
jgi:hypothetical protein